MEIGEMSVKIVADTSEFDKAMEKSFHTCSARREMVVRDIIRQADKIASGCDPEYKQIAFIKAVELLTNANH